MIIDAHTSIPPDWLRQTLGDRQRVFEKATISALLGRLDDSGVDKAILFSIARKPEQVSRVNDFIADHCKRHPDRLIGFANVYPPDVKGALAEIDRAVGVLGMVGLKIHPLVQGFRVDHPSATEILERAKEYGLPIIIHASSAVTDDVLGSEIFHESRALELQGRADERQPNAQSSYLVNVVGHYNDRKLYAAHLGGVVLKTIQDSNISFQTPGATVEGIEYAVKVVGADRITFGSDFPLLEIRDELEKVKRCHISEADKKKILGENVRKALRI